MRRKWRKEVIGLGSRDWWTASQLFLALNLCFLKGFPITVISRCSGLAPAIAFEGIYPSFSLPSDSKLPINGVCLRFVPFGRLTQLRLPMSEILNRFSLEAAKFNFQVFACLLLIWFAIVYCAMQSIASQSCSPRQRRIWRWIVVGVPLFGLLAYLPFSIRREDAPHILLLRPQKDRTQKKVGFSARAEGGQHS